MPFSSKPGAETLRAYAVLTAVGLTVFSAVPSFQAPDGHNFTAYYLFSLFAVMLLPVRWEVKAFAVVVAASCVQLMVMVACVTPKSLSPVFFKLYVSANCDYQFVLIFIGLYAAIRVIRPSRMRFLDFLCVVALAEVIRISLQRLGWDPVYVPVNGYQTIKYAAGSQGNDGWSAMVLALCVPGFLRKKLYIGLIPVFSALILKQSLVPAAAAIAAVGIHAFFTIPPKMRPWCALAAVSALVLYAVWDATGGRDTFTVSETGRIGHWIRAFGLCAVRESWLLGYGQGSWIFLFPKPGPTIFRAHCEPLQVWFELGAAGVLSLLFYARFLILRFAAAGRAGAGLTASSGMAAVIVCAAGNFPFHLAGVAAICVSWMAVFENWTEEGL